MDVTADQPPGGKPTGHDRTDYQVIGLVGVAHFFSHFYIYLLPPLFPFLKPALGVSYVELGILIAVFSATTGLTQVPFGFLVDRIGARVVLIAGLGVESAAFLLMGVADGYWMMMVLMFVAGCANGVYHPADYAILSASVSGPRMGRAFSLHTFAGYAGFAAAGPVIVFLTLLVGWRYGLVIAGAAGLATMGLLLMFARQLRHAPHIARRRGAPAPVAGTGVSLLLSPPILLCLGFFTLLSLGSTGIASFLIVGLHQLHGTEIETATLVLSAYLIAGAAGVLLGGFVADRTRRHNLVAALCFIGTAGMIAAVGAFALPLVLLFILMVLQGLMHGVIMPSRDMIVRSVTPEGAFGRVFGFVTSGFSIGGVIAPPLFGWILDNADASFMFFGIAAIMLCSTLTVFVSGRRDG